MKKKALLIVTLCIMLACVLAISVSAESVHNESTVDYDATVTLDNGTCVNLFDEEGNALIWFMNGAELQSIRADDTEAGEDGNYVKYITPGNGYSAIANIEVHIGATTIQITNIVVLNLMDDDINTYFNNSTKVYETGNAIFKTFVETFNANNKGTTNLEYAYLRHDTIAIGASAFAKCYKLKYVNFENLTELTTIGPISTWDYGWAFYECTALFSGGTLDLSKTKLATLNGGSTKSYDYNARSTFYGMTMTSVILPSTLQTIGVGTFYNCTKLKTISLGANITTVDNAAFYSVPLQQIFFYGTLDEINDLVECTSTTENGTFLTVLNNKISYAEYKVLEDKSGSYVVYDVPPCAGGAHGAIIPTNACVGACEDCGKQLISHTEGNVGVIIKYVNYAQTGTKTTACKNEGCTYIETADAPAIFECLGYSMGPDNNGIATGFVVNHDSLQAYEESCGKKLTFGVVVLNPKYLGEDSMFTSDGKINASKGALQVELNLAYTHCKLSVSGMSLDNADHASLELVFAGYAYAGDDASTIQVFQKEYVGTAESPVSSPMASKVTRGENVLYTIKLQSVIAPAQITTSKEDLLEF